MCVGSAGRFIYDFYYKLERITQRIYVTFGSIISLMENFPERARSVIRDTFSEVSIGSLGSLEYCFLSTRTWFMTISMNQVTSRLQVLWKDLSQYSEKAFFILKVHTRSFMRF